MMYSSGPISNNHFTIVIVLTQVESIMYKIIYHHNEAIHYKLIYKTCPYRNDLKKVTGFAKGACLMHQLHKVHNIANTGTNHPRPSIKP